MVNSKKKGGRFEREVCRDLSLWVSNNTRQDVFWRSAMSGGRATVGLSRGLVHSAQVGDVSAIVSAGESLLNYFVIECKAYRELGFLQWVLKDSGRLRGFWETNRKLARRFGKMSMLIARQNRMPVMCIIPVEALLLFDLSRDNILVEIQQHRCVVMLFECFLQTAKVPAPDVVVKLPNRVRLV